jgi:hypothetical protein
MTDLNTMYDSLHRVLAVRGKFGQHVAVQSHAEHWGMTFEDRSDGFENTRAWVIESGDLKLDMSYTSFDSVEFGPPSYSLALWRGEEVLRHDIFMLPFPATLTA